MSVATAKKGRVTTRAMLVELPQNAEENAEENAEQKAASADLERVAQESPRTATTRVVRFDQERGIEKYCGTFSTSMVTEDFLARKFGGGKFKLTHYKPTTKGPGGKQMDYAGQSTVNIDETVLPDRSAQNGATPVVPGPMETAMLSFVQMMQVQMQQQLESSRTHQTMMLEMFRSMREGEKKDDPLVLALVQGMISKKDPMELATSLLAVMKENGTGKDPIEQLKSLAELRDLLGGNGEKPDELSIVARGLGVLEKAMTPPSPGPVTLPAPTPVHELNELEQEMPRRFARRSPPAPTIDTSGLRLWHKMVAELLPRLPQAMGLLTPHGAADTLWDKAGDAARADVKNDLLGDGKEQLPVETDESKLTALTDDFISRAETALRLTTLGSDEQGYVVETLYELAELAWQELVEPAAPAPEEKK